MSYTVSMTNHDSNGYQEQSRRFLGQAWVELEAEDLRQASEKGWGAASQMVKAYADRRGFDHNSHARLYGVVSLLVEETDDNSYRTLFNEAGGLHENFYEGQFTSRDIRDSLEQVAQFVDRVEGVLSNGG